MTKEEKILNFNPNNAGLKDSNIFGLPFTCDEADVVLIPVPWEVTVSYGSGASDGPAHILETSVQVDLYHEKFKDLWKRGIAMADIPEDMLLRSADLKQQAQHIIEKWEDGVDVDSDADCLQVIATLNKACEDMNLWVEQQATYWLGLGKCVGLVGGDHSTPLGYFRALAKKHGEFGILHIDAHMDLRIAYEGFTYSHASIMYNALQLPELKKLVQVAVRDYCEEEVQVATEYGSRVHCFTNTQLTKSEFEGKTWQQQCTDIIALLPQKVHISFDIDGLDPTLCPNTGTPVPGGLRFDQATYLLSALKLSGKQIIGFDLVEVAPGSDDWNGNVGSRLLMHLCGVVS
ncbi:MAG: agmatinase family protein [Flavobacteriales bacterium]